MNMMDEYDVDEYGGQHIEMKEVCAMNSKTTFSNRITIISSQTLRHILDTCWIHTGHILDTYCRHIQLVIFSVIIYYFVPLRFYAACYCRSLSNHMPTSPSSSTSKSSRQTKLNKLSTYTPKTLLTRLLHDDTIDDNQFRKLAILSGAQFIDLFEMNDETKEAIPRTKHQLLVHLQHMEEQKVIWVTPALMLGGMGAAVGWYLNASTVNKTLKDGAGQMMKGVKRGATKVTKWTNDMVNGSRMYQALTKKKTNNGVGAHGHTQIGGMRRNIEVPLTPYDIIGGITYALALFMLYGVSQMLYNTMKPIVVEPYKILLKSGSFIGSSLKKILDLQDKKLELKTQQAQQELQRSLQWSQENIRKEELKVQQQELEYNHHIKKEQIKAEQNANQMMEQLKMTKLHLKEKDAKIEQLQLLHTRRYNNVVTQLNRFKTALCVLPATATIVMLYYKMCQRRTKEAVFHVLHNNYRKEIPYKPYNGKALRNIDYTLHKMFLASAKKDESVDALRYRIIQYHHSTFGSHFGSKTKLIMLNHLVEPTGHLRDSPDQIASAIVKYQSTFTDVLSGRMFTRIARNTLRTLGNVTGLRRRSSSHSWLKTKTKRNPTKARSSSSHRKTSKKTSSRSGSRRRTKTTRTRKP